MTLNVFSIGVHIQKRGIVTCIDGINISIRIEQCHDSAEMPVCACRVQCTVAIDVFMVDVVVIACPLPDNAGESPFSSFNQCRSAVFVCCVYVGARLDCFGRGLRINVYGCPPD